MIQDQALANERLAEFPFYQKSTKSNQKKRLDKKSTDDDEDASIGKYRTKRCIDLVKRDDCKRDGEPTQSPKRSNNDAVLCLYCKHIFKKIQCDVHFRSSTFGKIIQKYYNHYIVSVYGVILFAWTLCQHHVTLPVF